MRGRDRRRLMYLAVAVAVLAVAVFALSFSGQGKEPPHQSLMDGMDLKVFGNVDGDRYLDEDDMTAIQHLVDTGATVTDSPYADANFDGVIDSSDVDVVRRVIAGEPVTLWHVNHHDVDGDGVTDMEIVSTRYPIESTIALGTGNNLMILYCLGIHDQVKGATYTTSADRGLYGDVYLDESRVVNLGKGMNDIELEGGRAGSSDVIAEEHVTALIANDSALCITNEDQFEAMGVDVVRIPAASADREDMIHAVMLMGLLFGEVERADAYLDLSLEVLDYVHGAVSGAPPVTAVASTMTGTLSVGDSDYRGYLELIDVDYPFHSSDFGGKTVIHIGDHPEVYVNYRFDRIIHAKSALSYGQTPESVAECWDKYTVAFSDWEHAGTGQYIVSTALPVALRVAYFAMAAYPDLIDPAVLEGFHQGYVDELYQKDGLDITGMVFIIAPDTVG